MIIFGKYRTRMTAVCGSLILSAALLLTGCGTQKQEAAGKADPAANQAEVKKEEMKKITVIRNFKAGSLDPHNSWETLRAGVVETLVRIDENLELKPWLATSWENRDELTWVFTIRDGVTFQDGAKLDAAAVKASFERGMAASENLAKALKIASMEANGQELTIITTQPHAALPSELVNPYASVISVEAEKKMGTEAFNNAPVGTGPFTVKSFTPDIEIQLERYDEYWDGKAKINEVTFKFNEDPNVRALALQSKEADIVYSIPSETIDAIKQDTELAVESVPGLRVHFLLYNEQKPLLQDVKVRKAFDLLLNRDSIANDIMLGNGTPANGPFNMKLPFANQEPVTAFNPTEAKKLLLEAGFTEGPDGKLMKDGKPLSMEIITYKARPELPLIAQLLQSDAAKIGVAINIKTVENADTYSRENKDWDILTYSNLAAPRGDAGYFLNSALMPEGSLNAAGIEITELSQIVMELNATSDLDSRVKLAREAVKIINQEIPHSYAVFPNLIVGVNKRVIDWKPGAEEYYMVTNKMDVK